MDRAVTQEPSPAIPLYCPFPAKIDPTAAAKADEQIAAWVERIGLFPGQTAELRSFQFGTLAALTHPNAADEEHLLLAAQFITALYAVDDHYCDEDVEGADSLQLPVRLTFAASALEPPSTLRLGFPQSEKLVLNDPVLTGLHEVMERIRHFGSPAQASRVRRESITLFLAMTGENTWRMRGHRPELWEYADNRKFNGVLPNLALIDVVDGYELPVQEYEAPQVRTLVLMASVLLAYINDLVSAAKESGTEIGNINLSLMLAAEQPDLTAEESVRTTVQIINDLMDDYLGVERDAMQTASVELTRYINGLRNFIRGALEWGMMSGRFHDRKGRPTPANKVTVVSSPPGRLVPRVEL